jgi:nucleoid DNA-binding protein
MVAEKRVSQKSRFFGARLLVWSGMKKYEIAKRMAREAGVSPAEAADQLDRVVRDILSNVRKGKDAELPGLGSFRQRKDGRVAFRREGGKRHE